jgi:glutathione S-transferase
MTAMPQLRLRYFPFPGRAGPIRDCLQIGGIPFVDEHIAPEQFRERRSAGEFPFGGLPVLDVESESGKVCAAQSNAILRYAGRLAGLYPDADPLQALKVDEALDMGEEISQLLGPSLHEPDPERKLAMRKVLAEETLPYWAACIERLLIANGSTGFLVGDSLSVADLKFYWVADFLTGGSLDGIPRTLLDDYPNIMAWQKKVAAEREARLAQAAASQQATA